MKRTTIAIVVGIVLAGTATIALAGRNGSGTYSYPVAAGMPVISGQTISSTKFNALMSDFSTEVTDSLSRSGKGTMSAPLRLTNGTFAAPSLTFDNDQDTGIYRIGANNLGITLAGTKAVDFATTGVAVTGTLTASSDISVASGVITTATSNQKIYIKDNLNAGSTDASVAIDTTATRAAGSLLSVRNAGVEKASINYAGDLSVAAINGTTVNGTAFSGTSFAGAGAFIASAHFKGSDCSTLAQTGPLSISCAGAGGNYTITVTNLTANGVVFVTPHTSGYCASTNGIGAGSVTVITAVCSTAVSGASDFSILVAKL